MTKSFTVRDLPPDERPRERLSKRGADALSSTELLAIIMAKGTKGESVMNIAQRLFNKFGNLKAIANASIEELSQIRGIGLAKASQIKAALEIGRRVDSQFDTKGAPVIKRPEDVEKLIKGKLRDKKKEYFIAIMLDSRNHLIKTADISMGSLNASLVHPREVFKETISASAAAVIFVHNHPSGNPEPSRDDIKLTKRLIEVGKLVDIEVLDHVIIGEENCISMKEEKLI